MLETIQIYSDLYLHLHKRSISEFALQMSQMLQKNVLKQGTFEHINTVKILFDFDHFKHFT